jgi:mannose-6-phosphate isomerase-like protein (cupin superfamily)
MNARKSFSLNALLPNKISAALQLGAIAGLIVVGEAITTSICEAADPPAGETGAILERFVEDYRLDPSLREGVFGIRILDEDWYVDAKPAADGHPASVTLHHSAPPRPTWYFTIDGIEVLRKLDRGEMNSETASVKAFSTDYAPMDVDAMEGYQPGPDFMEELFHTLFHFWTRGLPEVIPFGESYTRFTHGADVAVLYYQPGFRSGWVSLKKGQHANKDPRSQVNDFQSLLVITGGAGKARIGGVEIELKEGETLFIPEGVTHEFWNDNDEPMEAVLLMFGENA